MISVNWTHMMKVQQVLFKEFEILQNNIQGQKLT